MTPAEKVLLLIGVPFGAWNLYWFIRALVDPPEDDGQDWSGWGR